MLSPRIARKTFALLMSSSLSPSVTFVCNWRPRRQSLEYAASTHFKMDAAVRARLFAISLSVRVLVTGATGFIGRALVPRLQRNGHSVVAWARSDTRAMSLLGADIDVVSVAAGQEALVAALSDC